MSREGSLPCTYKCAATPLDDEYLPKLPAWYPLPARDEYGELLPEQPTEAERDAERRSRAIVEAIEGPIDNRRDHVQLDRDGYPPKEVTLVEGRCVYVLSEAESNRRHAVYRYSPQLSLMHASIVKGVEDGFNERGEQYALEASKDDEHASSFGQQR